MTPISAKSASVAREMTTSINTSSCSLRLQRRVPKDARLLLGDLHHGCTFRQLFSEGALVELGNRRPLQLVALIDEGHAESEADVAKDQCIFTPSDDSPRAHHG